MLTIKKTSAIRADYRKIENKQNEATVYLYGDIGGWFGIDHLEFVKEFNAIDAETIHLRVDSDGGDIFAARTIKTAIMQHKANVIGHVDGIAASAASFLLMGCDEIEIVDGGFLMIHNALSLIDILGFFNIDELSGLIDSLSKERNLHTKINETIANDYAKRSGVDIKEVLQWMKNETWFTAEEALENKLVDRVYDGKPVAGKYDLSLFNNVPEELRDRNQNDEEDEEKGIHSKKRDAETALRKAGFSRNDALKIVAKGFQDVGDPQTELINQDVGDPQTEDNAPQRDADNANQTEEPAEVKVIEDQAEELPIKDRTYELIGRANKLTNFK